MTVSVDLFQADGINHILEKNLTVISSKIDGFFMLE